MKKMIVMLLAALLLLSLCACGGSSYGVQLCVVGAFGALSGHLGM